jgi:2-keto-4-pentenoate hydratase/2-oxohepta-3-ene-1,7-dioic acid hydratase in catechol pathway
MKLLRYGPAGYEKPGLLDASGAIRDLSGVVDHVTSEHLSDKGLAKLAKIKPESLPKVSGSPRLGVPYLGISKFIAIGLNYADHAAESNLPIPSEPIVFSKATTCIGGPDDDIMLPRDSTKTDWEVELGVVIGTTARYVEAASALAHVAGYCVINDISERNFQLERGSSVMNRLT